MNRRWSFLGYNGVLAAFLILGFYFVVSGWTAEYMVHSATGEIARYSTAEEYKNLFETFISNPWRPVTFEKSGAKRNFSPASPPGISSEWTDRIIRMTKSGRFSTPVCSCWLPTS